MRILKVFRVPYSGIVISKGGYHDMLDNFERSKTM